MFTLTIISVHHHQNTQRYGWGGILGGSPGATSEHTASFTNNRRDGFSYDAAGNLTNDLGQQFTYDAEGRQATASYSGYSLQQDYDGERLRVKKVEQGETSYYLRSSSNRLQSKTSITNTSAVLIARRSPDSPPATGYAPTTTYTSPAQPARESRGSPVLSAINRVATGYQSDMNESRACAMTYASHAATALTANASSRSPRRNC